MDNRFEHMPTGMLRSRIEELNSCIDLDEKHLSYLRSEKAEYWTELATREIKKKPCPSCGSTELTPSALFDEGGVIDCLICKCGQVVPIDNL